MHVLKGVKVWALLERRGKERWQTTLCGSALDVLWHFIAAQWVQDFAMRASDLRVVSPGGWIAAEWSVSCVR